MQPATIASVQWVSTVALALALAVGATGCPGTTASEAADGDDDLDPGFAECVEDTDCVPAGASCCECPTFALSAESGFEDSCGDVRDDCADPGALDQCADTVAVCESGACALQCRAVECGLACENGFASDAFGCLVCECATEPPGPAECELDVDCVRVPADCCGCDAGGADTAVPTDASADFLNGLECDRNPVCPGVDTCDPDAIARCATGVCVLAAPDDSAESPDGGPTDSPTDPQYCGGAATCDAGLTCVLNDPAHPEATAAGLGVCLAR